MLITTLHKSNISIWAFYVTWKRHMKTNNNKRGKSNNLNKLYQLKTKLLFPMALLSVKKNLKQLKQKTASCMFIINNENTYSPPKNKAAVSAHPRHSV